jgi:hypothetical protein
MMGHEASTLAREYGPQWMNMPNLARLNQLVRWASVSALVDDMADAWALLVTGIPSRSMHAMMPARPTVLLSWLFPIRKFAPLHLEPWFTERLHMFTRWAGDITCNTRGGRFKFGITTFVFKNIAGY